MASDALVEAVGGAIGSVISMSITYPLIIVSTWQALEHKGKVEHDDDGKPKRKEYRAVPSPLKELCQFADERGWQSLFAGLKPTLVATAVSQGIYFYLYSATRQAVVAYRRSLQPAGSQHGVQGSSRTEDIGVLGSILVASLAGCGNVIATNPVWVISTQLQALQRSPEPEQRRLTATQVASQLYRESGFMGFWKGLLPALVMVVNPTIQYILYEWLVARLLDLRRAKQQQLQQLGKGGAAGKGGPVRLSPPDVFALTAVAKLASTLVTYPMLVVKSRLQAMNSKTDREAQYKGVFDAVKRILKAEGMAGFYKGLRMKMAQTVLTAALLMSIKEQVYGSTRSVLLTLAASQAAGLKRQ